MRLIRVLPLISFVMLSFLASGERCALAESNFFQQPSKLPLAHKVNRYPAQKFPQPSIVRPPTVQPSITIPFSSSGFRRPSTLPSTNTFVPSKPSLNAARLPTLRSTPHQPVTSRFYPTEPLPTAPIEATILNPLHSQGPLLTEPTAGWKHSINVHPPPVEQLPLREEVQPRRADENSSEEIFPKLPPAPNEDELEPLPPLEQELYEHGGSYLYAPEGDRMGIEEEHHYKYLRLPESWQEPRPITAFQEFLGADPIRHWPNLKWPGAEGYAWEPRFVAYGAYQIFGIAFEQQDTQRQDGLGHQLRLDFDLRLTGTERFHVQYRPIGRKNSGGSFYQLSDPQGYFDNSTATLDRYWFEGELASMFSPWIGNPFHDYNVTVGKFAYALHNNLLINDEILGMILSKNNIQLGTLSNLNIQGFYGFNDVDAIPGCETQVAGIHTSLDWRMIYMEATFAYLNHETDPKRDASYAAFSATRMRGPWSLTGRTLLKFGDEGGIGSGELFVLESNFTRKFSNPWLVDSGFETGVFYYNAFHATAGWSSISGGNFDRLQSAFEVNPLIALSLAPTGIETSGITFGAQLFRLNEDESFVPEYSVELPGGVVVHGFGLRYQRKTGPRSFFEARGIYNTSANPIYRREGVFLSQTILF